MCVKGQERKFYLIHNNSHSRIYCIDIIVYHTQFIYANTHTHQKIKRKETESHFISMKMVELERQNVHTTHIYIRHSLCVCDAKWFLQWILSRSRWNSIWFGVLGCVRACVRAREITIPNVRCYDDISLNCTLHFTIECIIFIFFLDAFNQFK